MSDIKPTEALLLNKHFANPNPGCHVQLDSRLKLRVSSLLNMFL